ncbi:endonuclease I [Bacillus ectoiniformans]|uniref:endonuclease I family protein n=1 Tax=Bacillus ectoiniformans TaxID=1494429 RepID=UPI00195A4CE3|nr:endonuclease [Bacillus ectoiniformans]MBM7649114.1 endonuclease I [Bacillus ectoiniformans]
MAYTRYLNSVKELEESINKDWDQALVHLSENKRKIQSDQTLYYDEHKDQKEKKSYYRSIKLTGNGKQLFNAHHELVKRKHIRQIPYFFSKDQYLYTWVDMQPDGSVKSIYSGEHKDPKIMLKEDYDTIHKKHQQFQKLLEKARKPTYQLDEKMRDIDTELKFNTEHIIPQSWFGAREPMKGDLHHLFVCEPNCNTARSNFPFEDFSFYNPESPKEKIRNRCGVAVNGRFEPEDGKGISARAVLYFLLRYPDAIRKSFLKQLDVPLLIRWHKEFPVTIYEKHRNRAIAHIQGNRNPFIDFSDLAEKIPFK